jgi:hypothetical protein
MWTLNIVMHSLKKGKIKLCRESMKLETHYYRRKLQHLEVLIFQFIDIQLAYTLFIMIHSWEKIMKENKMIEYEENKIRNLWL